MSTTDTMNQLIRAHAGHEPPPQADAPQPPRTARANAGAGTGGQAVPVAQPNMNRLIRQSTGHIGR